jgi:hypothetical protein
MTFDAWYRKHWDLGINIEAIAKSAWNAAMEDSQRNPPKGLYRIGEEVELLDDGTWVNATVVADNASQYIINPAEVRRKPVWVPKDGEEVLFNRCGITCLGVWHKGNLYYSSGILHEEHEIRPVDYDKVGKPWDEV